MKGICCGVVSYHHSDVLLSFPEHRRTTQEGMSRRYTHFDKLVMSLSDKHVFWESYSMWWRHSYSQMHGCFAYHSGTSTWYTSTAWAAAWRWELQREGKHSVPRRVRPASNVQMARLRSWGDRRPYNPRPRYIAQRLFHNLLRHRREKVV